MDTYRNDDDTAPNTVDTTEDTPVEAVSEEPTMPIDKPLATPLAIPSSPPPLSAAPQAAPAPSPGIIVLQWLTYAFWGWTLLALSVLIFIVIFNLMNQTDSGNTSLYTLAAIVVLLPISLICDFIYQKHELKKKQGVSMAVMVIHAVIFALFAIGTLIGSLFSIVQLMVNSGTTDSTNSNVALFLSLLIISLLYSVTFFRTLNPLKSELKVARIFDIAMLVIIGVFTILAFVGPFAQTFQTKNDRFIEANISSVESGIDAYAKNNHKLPASLKDVTFQDEGAQQLIDKKLVTYKQDAPDSITGDFRYQLCVNYALKDHSRSYGYTNYQTDEYSSYITTSGHKAGDVCYKLQTANYTQLFDNKTKLNTTLN